MTLKKHVHDCATNTVELRDFTPEEINEFELSLPEKTRQAIRTAIASLEAQQTPRRLREAALTAEGKSWLENIETQISALRAQLDLK